MHSLFISVFIWIRSKFLLGQFQLLPNFPYTSNTFLGHPLDIRCKPRCILISKTDVCTSQISKQILRVNNSLQSSCSHCLISSTRYGLSKLSALAKVLPSLDLLFQNPNEKNRDATLKNHLFPVRLIVPPNLNILTEFSAPKIPFDLSSSNLEHNTEITIYPEVPDTGHVISLMSHKQITRSKLPLRSLLQL